jgi:aminopeptidase N
VVRRQRRLARWQDIWLNEGFATYAEWLWQEHEGERTAQQSFDRVYSGFQLVGADRRSRPGAASSATPSTSAAR